MEGRLDDTGVSLVASIIDDRGYNQGFRLVESTRIRMRRRAAYINSLLDTTSPKDILEIGCGTGEVSFWLAESSNHRVLGTDLCAPFIEAARAQYARSNLNFEVVDFTNPTHVKGRRFDYIVGNGILHHLYPSLRFCLETMHEMLNENGKIIFLEPNIYNPYCAVIFNVARKWANLEPDEMAFSRRFISKLLHQIGYKDVEVAYRDFLVPGVPACLVQPIIAVGDIVERVWPVNRLSQSIFISATKGELLNVSTQVSPSTGLATASAPCRSSVSG